MNIDVLSRIMPRSVDLDLEAIDKLLVEANIENEIHRNIATLLIIYMHRGFDRPRTYSIVLSEYGRYLNKELFNKLWLISKEIFMKM